MRAPQQFPFFSDPFFRQFFGGGVPRAPRSEVQRALDQAGRTLDIRHNHVALRVLQDEGAVTGVLVLTDDGPGVVHAP